MQLDIAQLDRIARELRTSPLSVDPLIDPYVVGDRNALLGAVTAMPYPTYVAVRGLWRTKPVPVPAGESWWTAADQLHRSLGKPGLYVVVDEKGWVSDAKAYDITVPEWEDRTTPVRIAMNLGRYSTRHAPLSTVVGKYLDFVRAGDEIGAKRFGDGFASVPDEDDREFQAGDLVGCLVLGASGTFAVAWFVLRIVRARRVHADWPRIASGGAWRPRSCGALIGSVLGVTVLSLAVGGGVAAVVVDGPWRTVGTPAPLYNPPGPGDPTASRAGAVAAALRTDPLYVDPAVADLLDPPAQDAVRAKLRGAKVPTYVVMLPVITTDVFGDDLNQVISAVAQRNGPGYYVVLDQALRMEHGAHLVSLNPGYLKPDQARGLVPGTQPPAPAVTAARITGLVDETAKLTYGATPERFEVTYDARTYYHPLSRAAHELRPHDPGFDYATAAKSLWQLLILTPIAYALLVLVCGVVRISLRRPFLLPAYGRILEQQRLVAAMISVDPQAGPAFPGGVPPKPHDLRIMVPYAAPEQVRAMVRRGRDAELRAEAGQRLGALQHRLDGMQPQGQVPGAPASGPLLNAVVIRETAERLFAQAHTIPDLVGVLVLVMHARARIGVALAVPAKVAPVTAVCHINPLHGPAMPWQSGQPMWAGAVPVCPACATVPGGRDALLDADGRRPYLEDTSLWSRTGYGAFCPDLEAEVDITLNTAGSTR